MQRNGRLVGLRKTAPQTPPPPPPLPCGEGKRCAGQSCEGAVVLLDSALSHA